MTKINEINYIDNVISQTNLSKKEFENYLFKKPYSDDRRGWYLMDLGQVLKLLPPPPGRLLDIGVGSGWTSHIFGLSGYEVVGLDIAPSMVDLAKKKCRDLSNTKFYSCDYESQFNFGEFDCAVIYDSLHHSLDEVSVIRNIYQHLVKGGVLITVEPGRGHSQTADTLEVIRKFGTTEKDMEYMYQKTIMTEIGFSNVQQYYRLSEIPLENVDSNIGLAKQLNYFSAVGVNMLQEGFTSILVATK